MGQLQVKHKILANTQTLDILASLPDLGIMPSASTSAEEVGAQSGAQPPPGLLAALFKSVTSEISSASGRQLCGLLLATAKLKLRPPHGWVALVAEELIPHLMSMDLDALAEVWWSFEALKHIPGERALSSEGFPLALIQFLTFFRSDMGGIIWSSPKEVSDIVPGKQG